MIQWTRTSPLIIDIMLPKDNKNGRLHFLSDRCR